MQTKMPYLLTNDQIAKAYGGYDFTTKDLKAVCRTQRQNDLAWFKQQAQNITCEICRNILLKKLEEIEL